jgi:dUTP pyrophosphatase
MAKKTNKDVNKNLSETLAELDVVKEAKKTNKKTSKTKVSKAVESKIRETIDVKIKLLNDDSSIPAFAHAGDIGMDVVATDIEYNEEHDYYIYHTGIAVETDEGKALLLMPRSSISDTEGYLCNGVGLVDPFTYRGEVCFRIKNRTALSTKIMLETVWIWFNSLSWWDRLRHDFQTVFVTVEEEFKKHVYDMAPYKVGERIGQMVFVSTPAVNMIEVDELSTTVRGEGGFGSSGK